MDIWSEAILERFPEYKEKIMTHVVENEDFKCLCSDYGQCVLMLESLTGQKGKIPSTLEEYLEIKIELEKEVLKYLLNER